MPNAPAKLPGVPDRPPILVAGEALFDLVVTPGNDAIAAHPGGGPFNTARTIGRLGQPVAFLGRLSTDRFGERLARMLEEDGVSLEAAVRTDDPTTLALAETDERGAAHYRFYAEGTAAPGLTTTDVDQPSALHVGTLGLTFEPIANTIEALVERLAPTTFVMVDPNCRPSAINDRDAYRARLDRVLAQADVVKLSDDDAAWLEPDEDPIETARGVGPGTALLTRGPKGAVVVTAGEVIRVTTEEVEVVDTIGAGDAFGGGFLAWWHAHGLGKADLGDRDQLVHATRFAARVAALTCAVAGANPPRLRDLD